MGLKSFFKRASGRLPGAKGARHGFRHLDRFWQLEYEPRQLERGVPTSSTDALIQSGTSTLTTTGVARTVTINDTLNVAGSATLNVSAQTVVYSGDYFNINDTAGGSTVTIAAILPSTGR